jgi:hypothetical protein
MASVTRVTFGLQVQCRRKMLLEYFGESFDPVNCRDGRSPCDNCRKGGNTAGWRTRVPVGEGEDDEDIEEEMDYQSGDEEF